jgi:hypothetical protein
MNFNSLVLEELESPYKVIRDANEEELKVLNNKQSEYLTKPFDKAWLMQLNDKQSFVAPNYTEIDNPEWYYIVFRIRGSLEAYSTPRSKINCKLGANSLELKKVIDKWEFEKQLSPNTLNTFKGLIDEL